MRDGPSARCHSAIESLLRVGDVDPKMRRRRKPLRLRAEQHDHRVAELDLDVADAAVGAQHPNSTGWSDHQVIELDAVQPLLIVSSAANGVID